MAATFVSRKQGEKTPIQKPQEDIWATLTSVQSIPLTEETGVSAEEEGGIEEAGLGNMTAGMTSILESTAMDEVVICVAIAMKGEEEEEEVSMTTITTLPHHGEMTAAVMTEEAADTTTETIATETTESGKTTIPESDTVPMLLTTGVASCQEAMTIEAAVEKCLSMIEDEEEVLTTTPILARTEEEIDTNHYTHCTQSINQYSLEHP